MPDEWREAKEVGEGQSVGKPPHLSDAGIQAMQGQTKSPTDSKHEPDTVKPVGGTTLPEEPAFRPAVGEKGAAERAETGPAKPEKEIFYGLGLEGR